MDRISELPECIVHHILSSFNTLHALPVDLVRMSVLSKTWSHLTASFPVLDFNIHTFGSQHSFFKYVDYATSRFCHHNVTAHEFNLKATLWEPAELDIVNKCLELVLKIGVRKLLIYINTSASMPKYRLPNILLSVSALKSLTIYGCELPSSLMVDVVKFKSLVLLRLENVQIDDEAVTYLTASCPFIRYFYISDCHGFKRFCVQGHQNLKEVFIATITHVERMDIEAPNLSNLSVADSDQRGAPQMNLATCKKLTQVAYFENDLSNSNGYTDFLSNFPFIENLVLSTKFKCNNINFSCHSLRSLLLHSNCDLEDINIYIPNLVLFIYSNNIRLCATLSVHIFWPHVRLSTDMKACMQCYLYIDSLWFQKLRVFFDKKNGFKVLNLYIHALSSQKLIELEKLKAIELPPYDLEHVELQLGDHIESSAHVAFVDAVLWCCRPQSLTLRSSTYFEDVVKVTYEKLLQQEDECYTNILIVSPSSSNAQNHIRSLMSLPCTLSHEGTAISFIKEEVVQEEADSQRFARLETYKCKLSV